MPGADDPDRLVGGIEQGVEGILDEIHPFRVPQVDGLADLRGNIVDGEQAPPSAAAQGDGPGADALQKAHLELFGQAFLGRSIEHHGGHLRRG